MIINRFISYALIFISSFLLPVVINAQRPSLKLPMSDKKVSYDTTFAIVSSASGSELNDRAANWISSTFPDQKSGVDTVEDVPGKVTGRGLFKVITSNSGHYYWLQFKIDVTVVDNSYTIRIHDFYEKPVEEGISNEYSKIEYRWRDYRVGKPWSPEDKPLFEGLNEKTLALIGTFRTEMDK